MYTRGLAVFAAIMFLSGCIVAIGAGEKHYSTQCAEKHGTLSLTVNVVGAEVYIDGVLYGQTEKAFEARDFVVEAGKHDLVIKKAGFEVYQQAICISAGGTNKAAVELKAAAPAEPA
jgi:hypothetical protein